MSVVAVVGLGYIGLPLAVAFGRQSRTIRFDISQTKVGSYVQGQGPARELSGEQLRAAVHLSYTTDPTRPGCARPTT